MAKGIATIQIIAASGIHKELLDKIFTEVKVSSHIDGAILFETPRVNILMNSKFELNFAQGGISIEGFALIDNCLGKLVVLITNYKG